MMTPLERETAERSLRIAEADLIDAQVRVREAHGILSDAQQTEWSVKNYVLGLRIALAKDKQERGESDA